MQRDVFLVFTGGTEGHEAQYANWFRGPHLADMAALDNVLSARAYTLTSLDDLPPPAELCAIYETASGRLLLDEIGSSKGTGKLPVSDIQGAMSWRLFEGVADGGSPLSDGLTVLILLFAAGAPSGLKGAASALSSSPPPGVAGALMTCLSPAQSRRGRDYGHAMFLWLAPDANFPTVTDQVQAAIGAAADRRLLAVPA